MDTKNKKVLVVDDEAGFTKIVKLHLEFKGGYDVKTENNSLNAFSVAKEFKPDIILLDIRMPGMDGGEVLRQLKGDLTTRNIPVVFVTAMLKEGDVPSPDGTIDGQPFLVKPIGSFKLVECIEKILFKGNPSSSTKL